MNTMNTCEDIIIILSHVVKEYQKLGKFYKNH